MPRLQRFFVSLSIIVTVGAVGACATTDTNHYKPALVESGTVLQPSGRP